MRKTDVIRHFGSVQKAADALGFTKSAISFWGEIVPEGTAYKLQVMTGGALKVDPSLYVNRPKRGQTLPQDSAA